MNKFKKEYLKRRIVAIFLMAMMIFGCVAPLDMGVYADDGDKYMITFIDGVTDEVISEQEVEEGHDADEPTPPTHEGYVFVRWDSDKWKSVQEDATITAEYEPKGPATYTITFIDQVYRKEISTQEVEEGESATLPTPPSRPGYEFTNWNSTAYQDVHADATIMARYVYKAPGRVQSVSATPGYESIKLSWPKVTSKYGEVRYYIEVKIAGTNTLVTKRTTDQTTITIPFDPYPKGTDGVEKKATCYVRAYIYDSEAKKNLFGSWNWKSGVEVIHPMYVVVKTKRKANIYGSPGSSKAVTTAAKGKTFVAIGGSRINGENKRVVIKMGGQLRYIKSSDVKIVSMRYNSSKYYSIAMVENFVNTANNGKPIVSNPKTKKYPKRLIWVNTYNQRVYLFDWDSTKGRWYTHKDYKNGILCNTGKELTPYGQYKISNKWDVKKATGTRWWCIFNAVGIHEKLGDALGKPASGGCVRIPDAIAKRFYKELVKVGYTVLVY